MSHQNIFQRRRLEDALPLDGDIRVVLPRLRESVNGGAKPVGPPTRDAMLDRRPEPDFDAEGQREEDDSLHEHAQHVLPHEVVREAIRSDRFKS
jgi:hypothetical protein